MPVGSAQQNARELLICTIFYAKPDSTLDQFRGHICRDCLMRLVVMSIGRLKQGPERELAERYRERFDDFGRKLGFRGLEIHEIPESRARDAASRIAEEAAAILAAIPAKSVLVALDERGDNIDSAAFARHLGRWRDESVANTIFVIGGADGLSPDLRRKAKLSIAFGSATWPHQMVRVMLLEQVYRAATILAGHPYHRA
jgi:23S rRNA (pseudouridine1915-N3)-methyltransferase